jgi:hypothetical protein
MRTSLGNLTPDEGQKGVFDVEGRLIGITTGNTTTAIKQSYATIWNSSPVNQVIGTLSLRVDGRFLLTLNPGQQAPCKGIVGQRYYQYDINTTHDSAFAHGTTIGNYIDFGDGSYVSTSAGAPGQSQPPETIVDLQIYMTGWAESKFTITDGYTPVYRTAVEHTFRNRAQNNNKFTVKVFHSDTLGSVHFVEEVALPQQGSYSNLKGYFPQHLMELWFWGTRDSTINRTDSIYNWNQITSLQNVQLRNGGLHMPYLKNNLGSFTRNRGLKYLWLAPMYNNWSTTVDTAWVEANAGKHLYENFGNLKDSFADLRVFVTLGWGGRDTDRSVFKYELPKLRYLEMSFATNIQSSQIDSILNQLARASQVDSGGIIYSVWPGFNIGAPTSASAAAQTTLDNNAWWLHGVNADPFPPHGDWGNQNPADYFYPNYGITLRTGWSDFIGTQISRPNMSFLDVMQFTSEKCGYVVDPCENGVHGPREKQFCGKLNITFPATDEYDTPCSDSLDYAIELGTLLYNQYRDSLLRNFENDYIQKCLENASKEKFTVTHTQQEYHYTLYFYDQAGNLAKTVPPQGVDNWLGFLQSNAAYGNGNLTTGVNTWLQEVRTARANNTLKNIAYTFPTQYRYNTLNQVVQQKSPDGGLSKFWYDRLGRLAVSQNARQAAPATEATRQYSYTLYDVLGRINEVGQVTNTGAVAMTSTVSRNETQLSNWINGNATAKEQVTRTYYDVAPATSLLNSELTPRNLRNRVAYTTLTDGASTALAGYNYAAFYTYDIHGNVDTLLHDYGLGTAPPGGSINIPNVANMNGNRYKKIAYFYDLMSGKVNQVRFQPGKIDQYFHEYEYDAENRITNVRASLDGIIWEREARYEYYKHGPLARTVLGEQQVQGLDYAYTLQGWLKGLNGSSTMLTGGTPGALDMGGDGLTTGSNKYIAVDALAFNLNYFNGDYAAIKTGQQPFAAVSSTQLTTAGYRPLYNGNISSMAVSIRQFNNTWLYNYKYDQLNRIKEMDAYQTGFTTASNTWAANLTVSLNYRERITYDANGNIITYNRNQTGTATQQPMDNLTYWYQYKTTGGAIAYYNPAISPAPQGELTNKLAYVDDAVAAAQSTVDIDDQAAGNFTYDEIGNLKTDVQSSISNINWNVYNKIRDITYSNSTTANNTVRKIYYVYDAGGNRIGKRVERNTTNANTTNNEYTWYVRDAQGNVMTTYSYNATWSYASGANNSAHLTGGTLTLIEQHLYGVGRLGIHSRNQSAEVALPNTNIITFTRGNKFFELTNHLGNVLVTISDRKVSNNTTVGQTITYFNPVVITANDYYPFGMIMPGRNFTTAASGNRPSRHGFNGQERSFEIDANGNSNTAEFWQYDARLGRRWNVDPVVKEWESPYACNYNNPLVFSDPLGDDAGKKARKREQKLTEKYGHNSNFTTFRENNSDGNIEVRASWTDESGKVVSVTETIVIKRSWLGRQLNKAKEFVVGVGEVAAETLEFVVNVVNPDPEKNSLVQIGKFGYNLVTDFNGTVNGIKNALSEVDWSHPRTWGRAFGMVITPGAAAKTVKAANAATKAAVVSRYGPSARKVTLVQYTEAEAAAAAAAAAKAANTTAKAVPALRAAYVAEVEGLSSLAAKMRVAGSSSEEIARAVHALRRELGVKYKSLTPDDLLQKIYQRNLEKYGDKLGPTIEYLRQQGKSWDDIINSATRTGGKDLGF